MPIVKGVNGKFVGVLSDTSLDRDEEFMTEDLIKSWASDSNALPMLANHENKMEKYIGGWTNKKLVKGADGHSGLVAEPFFFSEKANPLAHQIENQVKEALEKGLGIGISIGAIPHETIEKDVNGVKKLGFNKAEIVEATIVPIQSNRNAQFTAMAKNFDITKFKEVKTMEKEFTKDDLSKAVSDNKSELEKGFNLKIKEMEVKVKEAEDKVVEADKKVVDAESKVEESENKVKEADKKSEDKDKEIKSLTAEIEKAKKVGVIKGNNEEVKEPKANKEVSLANIMNKVRV